MTNERRFAIIIGINDYEIKPLDFCVNDAIAVAQKLEEKCLFNNEDIYLITSDQNKTTKDITGHFESALKKIENDLTPTKDSIFFFFAGHGKYQFENSGLQFHDSFTEIASIFEKINILKPKHQCYVIDACESGGKVLTRNSDNHNFVDKYIAKSSGTLFMYASTEEENAREISDIKHGLFTYYFIKAIDNDIIYDEGILTPNRIQEFIAKETLKESGFKQTPVIESRTIGYYPFAYSIEKQENIRTSEQEVSDVINKKVEKDIFEYFPEIPLEIRIETFDKLKPDFENQIQKWIDNFQAKGYELKTSDKFDIYNDSLEEKLKDSIIKKSISEKINSLNNVFSCEREIVKPSPILSVFSMIDAMMKKNEPEYIYRNNINWNTKNIICKSIYCKSNDITKVSFGITLIVYQAIYGIGLAISSFYLDYNGYSNNTLEGPFTQISAYKYNNELYINILSDIQTELSYFEGMVESWNENRMQSINDFNNKSK